MSQSFTRDVSALYSRCNAMRGPCGYGRKLWGLGVALFCSAGGCRASGLLETWGCRGAQVVWKCGDTSFCTLQHSPKANANEMQVTGHLGVLDSFTTSRA